MYIQEAELIDIVGQNYPGTVAHVTKLPQTKNDGFHVEYQDGSERFARVGKYNDRNATIDKITIAGMLGTQGVPVPEVIMTNDGEQCVSLEDGRIVEMHNWVANGRAYLPTTKDIQAVATAMAGMHSAADSLDSHPSITRLSANPYTGMQPGARLPDETTIDYFTSRLKDIPESLRPAVTRDLPLMRDALVTTIPGKDWGIIHADLHGDQVLFDKDSGEFKALLDWEWMLYGPRTRDLAFSLYKLTEVEGKLSLPLAETFVETYTQERPVFPLEDLSAINQHLEWDATCRRTRWIQGVLQQVDSGKVNEERIRQLVNWFDDYSLVRAKELREVVSQIK